MKALVKSKLSKGLLAFSPTHDKLHTSHENQNVLSIMSTNQQYFQGRLEQWRLIKLHWQLKKKAPQNGKGSLVVLIWILLGSVSSMKTEVICS